MGLSAYARNRTNKFKLLGREDGTIQIQKVIISNFISGFQKQKDPYHFEL